MLTLNHLCLPLAEFSTLLSSETIRNQLFPPCTKIALATIPLPRSLDSTPFFKSQIRINPLEINQNGTGWEEWLLGQYTIQTNRSSIIAASGLWEIWPPQTFAAWAYSPDGTFYHQAVHGAFEYEEHPDGGFTYSIADGRLTWDPSNGIWNTSVNAEGFVTETHIGRASPLLCSSCL